MWLWFGAAALFLLMEMGSGTFYLLLVAVGLAASGVADFLGASLVVQIASGMVVSLAGLAVLHRYRRTKGYKPTQSDSDVVPDIGQRVTVPAWDEEGRAQVFYRGANWTARISESQPMHPGEHYIDAVHGLTLILRPGEPPASDASQQ